MKYILFAIIAFVLMNAACTKVEEGFLSDGIRYKVRRYLFRKGLPPAILGILFDGSTPPVKFEMAGYTAGGRRQTAWGIYYQVPGMGI